ncbi:hypothetical protein [Methylobacterium sp. D54C]
MMDRPILFSSPMVRALLAGRKTQTRRILTRLSKVGAVTEFGPSDTAGYDWHFRDKAMRWHDLRDAELKARLPWQIGDRLWAKETWSYWPVEKPTCERDNVIYRATDDDWECRMFDWRPSIFMPRWASRLTLLVTDVRVERLQDISGSDAEAEGIYTRGAVGDDPHADVWTWQQDGWHYPHPWDAFKALWTSINGSESWAASPWVVAVSFAVVERNIDDLPVPVAGAAA